MCMSTTYTESARPPRSNGRRPQPAPLSLAQLMRQAAQELKLLASEVSLVEREIEEFNRFYYAAIGPVYEEYKRLQQAASTEVAEGDSFAVIEPVAQKLEKTDPVVATLSKKIFRRVAKICHPDSAGSETQSGFFVKLNDAYRAQDLGGLLLLEQHLHKNTEGQTGRFMEEQLEMMEQARQALDQRKHDLMHSPAYKLRQKIFWAKIGGQDLIAQIKRHLERQILSLKLAA